MQVGQHDFQDYLILGDDIVIARDEVANAYIKMISDIGVAISISKSVTPRGDFSGVEFASRYIIGSGDDISPLPVGLLFQPTVESLFALWDELWERGVELNAWPNY